MTAEVALAMFLSSGLAAAVVLVSLTDRVNIDLFSFLFGSITTVSTADLYVIGLLTVVILAVVSLLYRQLAYASFDEDQAKAGGLKTTIINQVLILLAAVTVVVSLRVVGGLLIGALTVIPVAAAAQLARSFRQTLLLAVGFGLTSVVVGLLLAYYLDLAAGGTIVLTALAAFGVSLLLRATSKNHP